ncbi:hypothetical protein JYB64_23100, partial [Algoriphagus aestuarii]|nr:hypothetical protein [Algoriphagus aestuarii]
GELPARVDAAAYRTVQECMTNALRYASPPRLRVTVRRTADAEDAGEWLVIEAENPVAEPAEPSRTGAWGSGTGLAGMRERTVLLGGRFRAGLNGDGQWRVRVELPIES